MLTDTHCHFEDYRYDSDREEVIKANLKELAFAVNVAEDVKSFSQVLEMAEKYHNLYASLGIHPHHALTTTPEEAYTNILKYVGMSKKVVAIGECGLDYFWHNQDLQGRTEYEVKEAQINLFEKQISVAQKQDLPLILHVRDGNLPKDAYIDILEILKENVANRGTVHTFSSDLQIANEFLELGFYLGISGVITFDKTGKLEEVIREVPLEKLLLETDAPYLTPAPHRGKRNEPKFTEFVAKKISEIKNISYEEVLKVTEQNARKLFRIK